ncbi:hypothetical protein GCM10010423_74790 [Streptomyces levis]|uniref:Uncharacterized protein n=1 Tax=Streptomyces levis TaxID=285566 RepID=A0ABN3P3U7_9ACTN
MSPEGCAGGVAKMVPHVTPRGNGGVCAARAGEVRRVAVPAAVSAGRCPRGPLPARLVVVGCRLAGPWQVKGVACGFTPGGNAEAPWPSSGVESGNCATAPVRCAG